MNDPPGRFSSFLVSCVGLEELVNSLYETKVLRQGPEKCKRNADSRSVVPTDADFESLVGVRAVLNFT